LINLQRCLNLILFLDWNKLANRLPIEIGRWQGIERQNRTCNICDKNEIGDEFHYVLQCPSLHDDRRRLLDSTYLTRVNVLKFANLFQSRNFVKILYSHKPMHYNGAEINTNIQYQYLHSQIMHLTCQMEIFINIYWNYYLNLRKEECFLFIKYILKSTLSWS
jgi:hypothetical protein